MAALVEDDLLARGCSGGVEVNALAGIVLAAGASSRMGSPKALLRLDGVTFLDRMIAAFRGCCDPVIVVLGYHREMSVSGAVVAVNPRPERGMLSSLQCGLRGVSLDAAGIMFCPVDFPLIRPETARLVAQGFLNARPPVALPEFEGKHGHPVCVSPGVAEEILALPSTAQARDVIHRYMDSALIVPVDDPGVLADVDSPQDYDRLLGEAG